MDPIDWIESYFNVEQAATNTLEMPKTFAAQEPFLGDLFDLYMEYSVDWLKSQTGSSLSMVDATSIDSIFDFATLFIKNVDYIKDPIPKLFGTDRIYYRKLLLEINSQLYHHICSKLKFVLMDYFKDNIHLLISDEGHEKQPLLKITWIFAQLEPFRVRQIVERPIIDLIQTEIEVLVVDKCKDQFEEPMVQFFLDFLDTKLTGLVSSIFGVGSELSTTWHHRLKFHVYRTISLLLYWSKLT
jgi:hypothetical protein